MLRSGLLCPARLRRLEVLLGQRDAWWRGLRLELAWLAPWLCRCSLRWRRWPTQRRTGRVRLFRLGRWQAGALA